MKAKLTKLAIWIYKGNSSNGRDHARVGDFEQALSAYNYWTINGSDAVVERVSPSRVGSRAQNDSFGQTYAFVVRDAAALAKWNELIS